jgi:hypothetical protein
MEEIIGSIPIRSTNAFEHFGSGRSDSIPQMVSAKFPTFEVEGAVQRQGA